MCQLYRQVHYRWHMGRHLPRKDLKCHLCVARKGPEMKWCSQYSHVCIIWYVHIYTSYICIYSSKSWYSISKPQQRGKYKYTMTGIVHRGQNTMEKNELQSKPSSLNLQWNQRNLIQKLYPNYSQPNCCRRLQLFCLIRKARWAQWLDMLFLFSRSDLTLLDKLHNLSYVVWSFLFFLSLDRGTSTSAETSSAAASGSRRSWPGATWPKLATRLRGRASGHSQVNERRKKGNKGSTNQTCS